jgi:hypothetical protein
MTHYRHRPKPKPSADYLAAWAKLYEPSKADEPAVPHEPEPPWNEIWPPPGAKEPA